MQQHALSVTRSPRPERSFGWAFALVGIGLAGCAAREPQPGEPFDFDSIDWPEPVELDASSNAVDGELPRLPGPLTDHEVVALVRDFSWDATNALDEQDPTGAPAYRYFIIGAETEEQLGLLDAACIHWDVQPLLGEYDRGDAPGRIVAGSESMALLDQPGIEAPRPITLVWGLAPAAAFNQARRSALAGDPVFPVFAEQALPAGIASHPDGSIDFRPLLREGFRLAPQCEAPVANELEDVGVTAAPLSEIIRDGMEFFAVEGRNAFERFFEALSAFARAFQSTTPVQIALIPRNVDVDFQFTAPTGPPLPEGQMRVWLGFRSAARS